MIVPDDPETQASGSKWLSMMYSLPAPIALFGAEKGDHPDLGEVGDEKAGLLYTTLGAEGNPPATKLPKALLFQKHASRCIGARENSMVCEDKSVRK